MHRMIREKRDKRAREYEISTEYARKFPIPLSVSAKSAETEAQSAASSPHDSLEGSERAACSSDETVASSPHETESVGLDSEVRSSFKKALPAPLTSMALRAAARELPRGSFMAIESCLRCWLECRLDDAELTATVRSFSGASRTLRETFKADAPATLAAADSGGRPLPRSGSATAQSCGDQLATAEQLRDLASTASYCM